jgi:hypothetical protein
LFALAVSPLGFDFGALADFRDDVPAVFLAFALLVLWAVFARGLTRFFAAFVEWARAALRTFVAFVLFTVFFLRVATTNSLVAQTKIGGIVFP